jgi:flagellar hook-associated protein 1 FlgK
MAKIHGMMDIGKRSMMNSQTALQTTAHNIANKTTEGYSRQRVDLTTNPSVTDGRFQIGTGSRAATVQRVNDAFLDKQLGTEQGNLGFLDGQTEAMGRVEQVFNEQTNKGLNQYMSDFFNAWRELSNNPESTTSRTVVKETADALTKDFKRVSSQLSGVQDEVDFKVRTHVEEINKITDEIANLNQKITQIEINAPSNDERDRRDLLVRKLQQIVDVKVAEGDRGAVTISTAGNGILVSGFEANKLQAQMDPTTRRMQVWYTPEKLNTTINITERIRGGKLGGALQVRDELCNDMKNKMNEVAVSLASELNSIHTQGFDKAGRQGLQFFVFEKGDGGAAERIRINTDVVNDVNRIASASRPNAPADNTTANVISMLQFKQIRLINYGKALVASAWMKRQQN